MPAVRFCPSETGSRAFADRVPSETHGVHMQAKTGYSRAQILLHWLIAALIVGNWFISEGMEDAFDGSMEGTPVTGFVPTWHTYTGLVIMGLVVLRLVLRLRHGVPAPVAAGTLSDKAAGWVHGALYVLMIAVPALGAITWYGGIEATADLHVLAMNAMMLLALGHAAVALFHHLVLKDGLLTRMVRAN